MEITAVLSSPALRDVTVNFATSDGTAEGMCKQGRGGEERENKEGNALPAKIVDDLQYYIVSLVAKFRNIYG